MLQHFTRRVTWLALGPRGGGRRALHRRLATAPLALALLFPVPRRVPRSACPRLTPAPTAAALLAAHTLLLHKPRRRVEPLPTLGTTLPKRRPSRHRRATVQRPPRWITIPPPSADGYASLLDHFAAAGWITSRPPLTAAAGAFLDASATPSGTVDDNADAAPSTWRAGEPPDVTQTRPSLARSTRRRRVSAVRS